MNGIGSFSIVREVLSKVHPVPMHVRTLNDTTYARIFSSVSALEQAELACYKETVCSSAWQIARLPSDSEKIEELYAIAIRNLELIRHKQQLVALFDGFGQSVHTAFFRGEVSKLPFDVRVTAVANALRVKDQLMCPFKRLKLVELLIYIAPEEQRQVRNALVSMLAICPGRDFETLIDSFVMLVPKEERREYILCLAPILHMIDINSWEPFYTTLISTMQTRRASIVKHLSEIVAPDIALSSVGLGAIVRHIKMRLATPQVLRTCAQLTRLCTNAVYIPLIIQELASAHAEERVSVVDFLSETIPPGLSSEVVYEYMRRAFLLTPEDRIRVQQLVLSVQGGPLDRLYALYQGLNGPFMMADLEAQMGAMHLDSYHIRIHRDELHNDPFKVLDRLYRLFKSGLKNILRVEFSGELAIDVGGPAQELLATLVMELLRRVAPKEDDDQLYRPKMYALKEEHKVALHQLGALLLFCLHSDAKYIIGKQFDPVVFVALSMLTKDIVDAGCDARCFHIYEAMKSVHEDDQASLASMKANMGPAVIEAMQEELEPCFLLYRGMLDSPFSVELVNINYEELDDALQGVLDPNMVFQSLVFKKEVLQEPKAWIEEWILGLSDARLKQFLRLMTGSPALNKRHLNIEFEGNNIRFPTCTQTLTLPTSTCNSKKDMFDMLEFALKTAIKFNDR